MARAELEDLYRILVDARFEFIPRGEVHLREVYAIVKDRYPVLCDDSYLCSTNCKSGYNSPEWKHMVRTGLNEMKKRGEPVTTGSARGMWRFGPAGFIAPEQVWPVQRPRTRWVRGPGRPVDGSDRGPAGGRNREGKGRESSLQRDGEVGQ